MHINNIEYLMEMAGEMVEIIEVETISTIKESSPTLTENLTSYIDNLKITENDKEFILSDEEKEIKPIIFPKVGIVDIYKEYDGKLFLCMLAGHLIINRL